MRFQLIHEVGNRQRWKTREVISSASAQLMAADIAGLAGIQGVSVNPRTGSVIATFESVEGRHQLATYLASLLTCPPIRREARSKYPMVPYREPISANDLVQRLLPARAQKALTSLNQNRMVNGVTRAFRSGANGMPLLTMVVRPIISIFKGWEAPTVTSRPEDLKQDQNRQRLSSNDYVVEKPTLDFGPLARHIGIAPFMPMGVRAANALLGALPIIREGFGELFKGRINVAVLDAAALLVSLLRRDFKTAGLLVLLLGMGEMLENYARKKSMASLAEQLSVKVDRVWVQLPDGTQCQKPFAELTTDDQILVRTGNVIPVDGVVIAGDAAVNQSTMTGEPLAVPRTAGGAVFDGTVVECGELLIRPTNIGDGTRLAKIIAFVEESEKRKAGIESRALKFADAIVPFNFALAALVWCFTRDWTRTASVLLVDYSCALRLATPLAILSAMKEGTVRGVVVKGGRFLEALAEVDTVVFDKTGTLTNATPALSDVVSLDDARDDDELLRLSACLEEHFPHPVSRAIVDAAQKKGLAHFIEAHDAQVQYIVAHGICSSVDGSRVLLGSRHFIEDDEGIDCSSAKTHVDRLTSEPKISDFGAVDDEGKRSISLWHKQTPGIPGVDFYLERLYNILQSWRFQKWPIRTQKPPSRNVPTRTKLKGCLPMRSTSSVRALGMFTFPIASVRTGSASRSETTSAPCRLMERSFCRTCTTFRMNLTSIIARSSAGRAPSCASAHSKSSMQTRSRRSLRASLWTLNSIAISSFPLAQRPFVLPS